MHKSSFRKFFINRNIVEVMKEQDILNLIRKDGWMMDILRVVQSLNLPDWMIGAGFVRNKIWDYLHKYEKRTPLNDIDVIYFDKENVDEKYEKIYEEKLREKLPNVNWSATNQARMRETDGDEPYLSSEDALSKWPETVTCVAVKLDENNDLILIAPHGIEDIVGLVVNPSPVFMKKLGYYKERMKKKNWKSIWPKLKIN